MAVSAQDVAAINAGTESCLQALRAHDPEAYLKNCTNDIVFVPPGQAEVVGVKAAREFLESFPKPKTATYDYDEVQGSGDLAFARGTFVLTDENDAPTTIKAVLIFSRESDGSWKLARDIWHADS